MIDRQVGVILHGIVGNQDLYGNKDDFRIFLNKKFLYLNIKDFKFYE